MSTVEKEYLLESYCYVLAVHVRLVVLIEVSILSPLFMGRDWFTPWMPHATPRPHTMPPTTSQQEHPRNLCTRDFNPVCTRVWCSSSATTWRLDSRQQTTDNRQQTTDNRQQHDWCHSDQCDDNNSTTAQQQQSVQIDARSELFAVS